MYLFLHWRALTTQVMNSVFSQWPFHYNVALILLWKLDTNTRIFSVAKIPSVQKLYLTRRHMPAISKILLQIWHGPLIRDTMLSISKLLTFKAQQSLNALPPSQRTTQKLGPTIIFVPVQIFEAELVRLSGKSLQPLPAQPYALLLKAAQKLFLTISILFATSKMIRLC